MNMENRREEGEGYLVLFALYLTKREEGWERMKNGNMVVMAMIEVRERQEYSLLGARKCHVKVFNALRKPCFRADSDRGTQGDKIKNEQ